MSVKGFSCGAVEEEFFGFGEGGLCGADTLIKVGILSGSWYKEPGEPRRSSRKLNRMEAGLSGERHMKFMLALAVRSVA